MIGSLECAQQGGSSAGLASGLQCQIGWDTGWAGPLSLPVTSQNLSFSMWSL